MRNGDQLKTEPSAPPAPGQDGRGDFATEAGGRRVGRLIVLALILALIGGAIASYLLVLDREPSGGDGASADSAEATTAIATRRDLVETENLNGTLVYADGRTVVNQLSATTTGESAVASSGAASPTSPTAGSQSLTITRLTPEGKTKEVGQALYWVNGEPVILMLGATPAWRSIGTDVEAGEDIRQLEENLVALGYDPDGEIEVDREFDSATEDAIVRWQEDLGLEESGTVALGRVVFLPRPQRIGAHLASTGSSIQAGTPVLGVSSTEQVVDLRLEADRQDLVAVGDRVVIELPDGSEAEGVVAEIGSVAKVETAVGAADGAAEPYVEVSITFGAAAAVQLDQAPVDIVITTESKQDVLTVPVTALLALAGGGYAVEVIDGEVPSLVAVEPGVFANGFVEVESDDLLEGDRVVMPQ